MTIKNVAWEIEGAVGCDVVDVNPLGGGCVGQVYQVILEDKSRLVAKIDDSNSPRLDIEGYMLQYLAEHSQLPVPGVLYSTPRLLLMTFLEGESRFSARTQEHAADLLASLHHIIGLAFGLDKATLIGGLHQPNPWTKSWLTFFRDQRLLYMSQECMRKGLLSDTLFLRIARISDQLDRWLLEPDFPSLIHGDVWKGNVLAQNDKVIGFIDPAIYYAAPEIELAFMTLFGAFGERFFARYQEMIPVQPGFFEERRDLYNLYPLLVHVRLFGGSYIDSVNTILRRFGF